MSTTMKNLTPEKAFLVLRDFNPILMQSPRGKGWTFLCVPDEVQPDWDESLEFLRSVKRAGGALTEIPFVGGWVGFITYNQGCEWMGVESEWESPVPKMWWKFCGRGLGFSPCDEVVFFGEGSDELKDLLDASVRCGALAGDPVFDVGVIKPGISKSVYKEKFLNVRRFLREGETYQVNLAYDFLADFKGDPFALYSTLFSLNPCDMGFFAEDPSGSWAVCSNSPERLFSLRSGKEGEGVLSAQPVKGTLPRSEDPENLLNDPKVYSELTMITDLLRNDLGKVAVPGSVEVPAHMSLMDLRNVWHTYSTISAVLDPEKSVADVIKALFPGGSIVGCPKKRTMEIIDKLTNFSWGAYCGSAGYVSLNGNADFNIMIRTAQVFFDKCRARVSFGAGGGILFDSDSEEEYRETWDKAGIFLSLNN